jgi:hypothetical protein
VTFVWWFSLTATALSAEPAGQVFTDAESAGVDYQIQGEYVGQVDADTWGAQVIALGEGTFRSVGYPGGLPGAGWNGSEPVQVSGGLQDGMAVFSGDGFGLRIRDDRMQVVDAGGSPIGELKKVHRQSPTLGQEPPSGALVLFDGTKLEGWKQAEMVEGDLLGATGCETEKKFGDHTLHVEFRTPFMPQARGQGRGNSGVYVQGRYELQVLDSFGLEGKDNECGGIYSVSEPAVNMCLPPLAWQTYDIDFQQARYDADGKKEQNARITVRHNGVVIHDNLELPRGTPGRYREAPGPEVLFLQDHGNPVVFRNIWAVER